MKTIDQKLKEYIDEIYKDVYQDANPQEQKIQTVIDFNAGIAFAEIWIKCEDELPENQDVVFVKTDKGCYGTGYLHGKKSGFITYGSEAYKEFGEVIEWRPINKL